MALARIIARKSLLGRPGRTLFSILGVAVGIATVVAVFTLDHVTILSRTRFIEKGWGGDLEVRPSESVDDPTSELLELEGVAGVAAFFRNEVHVSSQGGEPLSARFVALDARQAPSLGAYFVESGDDLQPTPGADGVLLGRALAEQLGVDVGDPVVLAPPRRAAPARCVDGVLRKGVRPLVAPRESVFHVAGLLAREGLGRHAQGRVAIVDHAAGRRLFEDVFVETRYWVRRDPNVELESLESDLSRHFTFERNEATAIGQMADERAFRNGVRLAGLFALCLGLFVIFHTLSMSLLERVREVGMLSALGATRAQIARSFFSEAVVIALLAGLLGVAGGILLAKLLFARGITTLGVTDRPSNVFAVPWRTVLLLSSFGVVIALVGSIYPMVRARGTDIVGALRGEGVARTRSVAGGFQLFALVLLAGLVPLAFFALVPFVGAFDATLVRTIVLGLVALAALVAIPLFLPRLLARGAARLAGLFERRSPLVAHLAARSLAGNPARLGASVAAIALVATAFVALKGMTNSLGAEVEVWGEEALADKVYVEGLANATLDEVEAVFRDVPEVLGIEGADARAHVDLLLLGLRPEQLARYGPARTDPALLTALAAGQGVIVSERLARQRGLAPGDSVLVNTSGHGVQAFRVLAVSDAYGYFIHPDERAYAVTDARHLKRFFCVDTEAAGALAVRLDEGADPGVVAALLRERFGRQPTLRVTTGDEVLALHQADIARDFVLFDVILALTAVLAGLGVLNGMLLAALERQKELGVLFALGMTRGQLAASVLLESGILGLFGGGLGILVGSGLSPVFVTALRVLSGLELPLRGAGGALGACLGFALVLALVAGLYPIWRMSRTDTIEAVRTG